MQNKHASFLLTVFSEGFSFSNSCLSSSSSSTCVLRSGAWIRRRRSTLRTVFTQWPLAVLPLKMYHQQRDVCKTVGRTPRGANKAWCHHHVKPTAWAGTRGWGHITKKDQVELRELFPYSDTSLCYCPYSNTSETFPVLFTGMKTVDWPWSVNRTVLRIFKGRDASRQVPLLCLLLTPL